MASYIGFGTSSFLQQFSAPNLFQYLHKYWDPSPFPLPDVYIKSVCYVGQNLEKSSILLEFDGTRQSE